MKICRQDVLEGWKLYKNSVEACEADEDRGDKEAVYENWCYSILPVILESLMDVPSDKYSVWEVADNPVGYPDTPELNKMLERREEAQTVGEFLDWLRDQNISLCVLGSEDDNFHPLRIQIEKLIAWYLDLSDSLMEEERSKIIEYLRARHVDKEAPACNMHITTEDEEEDIEIR